MKIGTPKETFIGERRVGMTPESAVALQKLGHECVIESGAGVAAGFADSAYKAAGVGVVKTAAALWKAADVVAKVRAPDEAEMKRLREGQTLVSFFSPVADEAKMAQAAKKGATVIAMEMIPRISRAQKMDALSSMANIAGLPCGDRGGQQLWPVLYRADHGGGQGASGQGSGCGGGCGRIWLRSARPQALARLPTRLMCAPKWPNRFNRWAQSLCSSILKKNRQTARRRGAMRPCRLRNSARRSLAKFRELAPEIDIVITTALIPNREAPELVDRGHGGCDEAGIGDCRSGGGKGRQLQADGDGRKDRDRERCDDHRLYGLPQPDGDAGLDACMRPTFAI